MKLIKSNMQKILSIIALVIGSSVFAQDTTYTDTLSGRYREFVSVNSSFSPSVGNSNRTSGCSISCSGAKNYYIRTGYIGYDATADAVDSYWPDVAWTIVEDDCELTTEPRAPIVHWIPDHWGDMGEMIGSSSTGIGMLVLGGPEDGIDDPCDEKTVATYQTKFCVSHDATNFSFSFKCLADNFAVVYLNGVEIGSQAGLSYEENGFITSNILEVDEWTEIFPNSDPGPLKTGENVLEVVVTNRTSLSGLTAYAEMSVDQGCIGCCGEEYFGHISGYKYHDVNANGTYESGEPPVEGVQIDLKNSSDVVIATTTTDAAGYFFFEDVPEGSGYKVVESLTGTEWTCTSPSSAGEYTGISISAFSSTVNLEFLNTEVTDPTGPCTDCGNSFNPIPGEKYWMSAWVKVGAPEQQLTYEDGLDGPYLRVSFLGTTSVIPELLPSGDIIDGWQRIVGSFTVPSGADNILVAMYGDGDYETYFDDIRIHPFNGSMKSYVYDGETFWLLSELDDNNYATFYEYDNEGGLIRIKKETSRGVVTIQETRSNTLLAP